MRRDFSAKTEAYLGNLPGQRHLLRVCVLGLGGGGFHYECQQILNSVRRPLELVLVFSGPGGGVRRWDSWHVVRSIYILRSPSLMGDGILSNLYYGCVNFVRALQILIAEQPDVVFVVGSAQAVPFGLAGRLIQRPLWFVESITRVRHPCRTGKWVYRLWLYSKFFYFWPDLGRHYPRGICAQERQ
jgi:UDP-N-acetylglucosamine:LPS N-acetylglucosamine transferase